VNAIECMPLGNMRDVMGAKTLSPLGAVGVIRRITFCVRGGGSLTEPPPQQFNSCSVSLEHSMQWQQLDLCSEVVDLAKYDACRVTEGNSVGLAGLARYARH
jgi:hypothetical protein